MDQEEPTSHMEMPEEGGSSPEGGTGQSDPMDPSGGTGSGGSGQDPSGGRGTGPDIGGSEGDIGSASDMGGSSTSNTGEEPGMGRGGD